MSPLFRSRSIPGRTYVGLGMSDRWRGSALVTVQVRGEQWDPFGIHPDLLVPTNRVGVQLLELALSNPGVSVAAWEFMALAESR